MPAAQVQRDLEDDEDDDRRLEQAEALVAGDVRHQPRRVLPAPQLELERLVALDQVERGAQLLVDLDGAGVGA